MFKQFGLNLLTILFFFLLVFIYTKFAGPIPFAINSTQTTKSTTFDVTGEGKVQAKPDSATIQAGISARSDSIQAVQNQINTVSNNISTSVKTLGIDSKDIKTSNYNVNPSYDYTGGSQRANGYMADTNLTITVSDINKVSQVIDVATKNGATQVNNLGFNTTDKTQAENEARKQAVDNAKKKAADAASIAGFKLGRIVNYSEGSNQVRPVPFAATVVGSADKVATNVEPGSNEITVNVTLSYEIQ